uniref:Uncharacterized protein n=1 Tax=Acrobeloides nanus TaxID=290746 RepID=A0A914CBW7_9BILA
MPELNIEQETDPPFHKKLMSSSLVKSRLCCCCYNDGKATNPVTLTKAETITAQPTTSAGAELNRLSNGNGNARHENHAGAANVGEEFDEIDLTEVRAPASTSQEDDRVFRLKNKSPQEPMQGTIAAGVTDMMLDEIYEESAQEQSEPIEEPAHIDTNAVMEATDEEVESTLSRKTKAPLILAKMEGEILRVEKLEPSSPEVGGKLQRSSALNNLDSLKPIDADSVNSSTGEEKEPAQLSPTKPPRRDVEKAATVDRNNPFEDDEEEKKDDETTYSLAGSVKEKQEAPKPPTPNPSTDTILSSPLSNKEVESARKSPEEVEISPISESERLEPESRESESKVVLNVRKEEEKEEPQEILSKTIDMQEAPLQNKNRSKKASSTDEGLSTDDDETTTSTDYELHSAKPKSYQKSEIAQENKAEPVKTSRMYGDITSDESESESESIALDRVNKSPNRVSIKKNTVVITKVSIDNNNPESPSTGRTKKTADYVVLTDDEFSEKII